VSIFSDTEWKPMALRGKRNETAFKNVSHETFMEAVITLIQFSLAKCKIGTFISRYVTCGCFW